MMSKWMQTTWGELIELKYGKALRDYQDIVGEFPVYGTNGPVGWCNKPLCEFPSIIIGRKGAYRGVHYSEKPFFVIDTAYFVIPKKDINLKWAYYYLLTQDINSLDSGSAIPSTSREDVYQLPALVPPRHVQDEIVRVLDGFNNKIDLNRQTNQTLEQIAQAIFKSWFVDFDPVRAKIAAREAFIQQHPEVTLDAIRAAAGTEGDTPAHAAAKACELAAMCAISGMSEEQLAELNPDTLQQLKATSVLFPDTIVDSEHGELPKGWLVTDLGNLTTKIGSGATPRGGSNAYVDEGVSFVRSQNVYDSDFKWDGLAYINEGAADKLKSVSLERNDVLINITGASILRTCVVPTEVLPARVNQHVAIVRAKNNVSPRYIHLNLLRNSTKEYLLGMNAGASREAVTKGHLESVPILYPGDVLMGHFQEIVESLYGLIEKRIYESRSLATVRDTLLPTLLSGKLSPTHSHTELDKTA